MKNEIPVVLVTPKGEKRKLTAVREERGIISRAYERFKRLYKIRKIYHASGKGLYVETTEHYPNIRL